MARAKAAPKAAPAPAAVEEEVVDMDGMYVSPVTRRVASTLGHTLMFTANVPKRVPVSIRAEMLQYGILPINGDLPIEDPSPKKPVDPTGKDRSDKIKAAVDEMVAENKTTNFSAAGIPKTAILSKILGFEITDKERDTFWTANRKLASGNLE